MGDVLNVKRDHGRILKPYVKKNKKKQKKRDKILAHREGRTRSLQIA